ncbi:MAG: hypothetical protein Q8909_05780, partial [Bacteroidota bacterium]|nr:hypothetical protein [Bacteroidota bacterium]
FEIGFQNNLINSSSVVLPKSVINKIGGFPEEITSREDLYTWIKIASSYPVCYTDKPLTWYIIDETNARKRLNKSEPDFYYQFIEPGNFYKNEFLAFAALHKGMMDSIFNSKDVARQIAIRYSYTVLHQKKLKRLKFYNRIPSLLLKSFFKFIHFLRFIKKRITSFITKNDLG